MQSAEELERLTVDEKLKPIERAVYLLRLAVSIALIPCHIQYSNISVVHLANSAIHPSVVGK